MPSVPGSKSPNAIESVVFTPDGKKLMTSGLEGIILWDMTLAAHPGAPLEEAHDVTALAVSPDGRMLASGASDSSVTIWDIATRLPLRTKLNAHDSVRTV